MSYKLEKGFLKDMPMSIYKQIANEQISGPNWSGLY